MEGPPDSVLGSQVLGSKDLVKVLEGERQDQVR